MGNKAELLILSALNSYEAIDEEEQILLERLIEHYEHELKSGVRTTKQELVRSSRVLH